MPDQQQHKKTLAFDFGFYFFLLLIFSFLKDENKWIGETKGDMNQEKHERREMELDFGVKI
ncbi:MAG: hypothetical protein Q8P67_23315 [archaeon]|nr:hypothetical protein [archaeon]